MIAEFECNFDHEEQAFRGLIATFRKYYLEKGFKPQSTQEIKEKLGYLDEVMQHIREINHRNNMLKLKFAGDERFVCLSS